MRLYFNFQVKSLKNLRLVIKWDFGVGNNALWFRGGDKRGANQTHTCSRESGLVRLSGGHRDPRGEWNPSELFLSQWRRVGRAYSKLGRIRFATGERKREREREREKEREREREASEFKVIVKFSRLQITCKGGANRQPRGLCGRGDKLDICRVRVRAFQFFTRTILSKAPRCPPPPPWRDVASIYPRGISTPRGRADRSYFIQGAILIWRPQNCLIFLSPPPVAYIIHSTSFTADVL